MAEVKSITVKVCDKELTLTLQEVRELRAALNEVLEDRWMWCSADGNVTVRLTTP